MKIAEITAGAERNRGERIFGDMHGQTGFFTNEFIETAQESPATGEDESAVNEIRRKFRRCSLERDARGFENRRERFGERFADFFTGDRNGFRKSGKNIAAFYIQR